MKRAFVVAVGGAALVIAGLSGCSSDNNSSSATTTEETTVSVTTTVETTTVAESPSVTTGAATTKVTIDGQDQAVEGNVVCATTGGNVNIAIGESMTGIAAVVSEGDAPTVSSVALGNVDGVSLGFTQGAGGEATAEKDGNTYKISGTATGVDMANPTTP
ncbi:lipoprotein LpqH, partial [Mycolicibacterium diernhoferi]